MRRNFYYLFAMAVLFFSLGKGFDWLESFMGPAQSASDVTTSDSDLGWDFRGGRGHLFFNDIGLRSHASRRELKSSRKRKIVLLGNSVVQAKAYPYESSFAGVLQRRMNEVGRNIEVLCAGFDGYEAYREFAKYRRDLADLKARVVVWFPNRNDFTRSKTIEQRVAETNSIHHFSDESVLKRALSLRALNGWAQRVHVWKTNTMDMLIFSEHHQYYTQGLRDALDESVHADLSREIHRFNELLKSNGTRLVAVFLPTPAFLYYGNTWEDARAFKELRVMLYSEGIPNFEFFSDFGNSAERFSDYVHLNLAGHELVGKKLYEYLKDRI